MKRIISIIISLVILLQCAVFAGAEAGSMGEVMWSVENGELKITGNGAIPNFREFQNIAPWSNVKGNIKKITVGEGITYIGSYAFVGCTNVTEVRLPESLTHISMYAFYKCQSLSGIHIPQYVTSIGDAAFRQCYRLNNVVLPENLNSLGNSAFYDCWDLESITIPDSVTGLGNAFWHCKKLKTINIGKNASIVFNNFDASGCESLESINVSKENMNLMSEDGILFDFGKTTLIKYPAAKSGEEYVVPESVRAISSGAFGGSKNLKTIRIKGEIEEIKQYAFGSCENLENIIFEKSPSFKELGMHTLSSCAQMKEFIIPSSVEVIGENAIYNNGLLESVVIPKSVKKINTDWQFFKCDNVTDIYYMGTKAEWESVKLDGSDPLHETAKIHFVDDKKDDEITVRVNGGKINSDVGAFINDGRTMVPLRAIFEALGCTILWDDATKTVTAQKNNTTIKLTIGEDKLYKDNSSITLGAPALIADGRTMVPVRAISEALGATVTWDDIYNTVRIVL